ncbi:hypothetical protein GNF82_13620 [Clostridium perfringens]
MVKRNKHLQYDVKAVVYLLKERAALEALRDKGDITATQILVDLDNILKEVEPTVKQAKAVDLVWVRGYTLSDAGEILNITAQGVYFNLKLLKKKIKAVTERWANSGKFIV